MVSLSPRSDDRGQLKLLTFARFMAAPENRSALAAVQAPQLANPLFLHGPSGTGKTHLAWAVVQEATRRAPGATVAVLSANELDIEALAGARDADVVVIEDFQHLPARAVEAFVQLFDTLIARRQQVVVTAAVGPRHLDHLPARLTSRLASGLVVGIEPLSAASRFTFLRDQAQRRQLAVSDDVLRWLADPLSGGRQLQGALSRLELLVKMNTRPLDVAMVAEHFREQVEATRPTVERIARHVGTHFQVEPRQLQSRRQSHKVLWPRQVGMYLARQLTGLSFAEIGGYFGGRDHSTVLHACRKVEQVVALDAFLGGTVRQLHADLA